jgi:hypothetical protein
MKAAIDDAAKRGLDAAFARGNYHHVAANGAPDDWRTHAALGLCGRTGPALARLAALDDPQSRFHEGVIRWIDGDEDAAIRLLAPLDNEYADNLLRLIRKPRISILSQLSWFRSTHGPHNVLLGGEKDPKFEMRNISFAPGDLPNRPGADIHDYYDSANPPDLYLAEMIEWHVIPPNLQELPCPIIGQTGDYDLHIQMIVPWLRLFDEVMVTDTTEFADVQGLVDAPVTTFCKPVSLPPDMPPPIRCEKDFDMVVTGTLLHSYYPDKAEMMRQILDTANFEPFFYNGFFPATVYYPILARSKLAVALPRHLGAIPSRGYEALAMGTVLLAPHESCQRLFTGDGDGIYPFSLEKGGLRRAIETVMADYDRYAEGAMRGMDIIRAEFDPWRATSQYLRMAVFLAARPRPQRRMARNKPVQMRTVAFKGFVQHGGEVPYQAMRNACLETWKATPDGDHTPASISLPARELLLEYEVGMLMPPKSSLKPFIETALRMFGAAVERFPRSLALRFNFIRAAFHFGDESDTQKALVLAKGALNAGPDALLLEPLDDIMTWDFCQTFFNYRTYLQIATQAVRDNAARSSELKALILASLHYYCGRMSTETGHFASAATLDPEFSVYRLWQARELDRAGDAASAAQALPILTAVIDEVAYAPEAWSLAQAIKAQHGLNIADEGRLANLVARLERRTLIDESYLAIRNGPYFRAQRLSLARNTGLDIRKHEPSATTPRLSILLADTNGSRYAALIGSLNRQSLARAAYEIICCDVFERDTPHMMAHADTLMVIGQNEFLYNRNTAFNAALIRARAANVVYFDRDTVLPESTLTDILHTLEGTTDTPLVVVNTSGQSAARDTVHAVALSRNNALQAGGLDESAYHAGFYSGPYELVQRLKQSGFELRGLAALPSSTDAPSGGGLSNLLREVWPDKFTPERTAPLRENPQIAEMRRQLA